MADRKKQHYVPQFYLRLFSRHPDGTAIGVYNIPSKRFICHAKLRTQAYRNYFYGTNPDAEERLSLIEGQASSVIMLILKSGIPPTPQSKNHHTILTFTIFQKNRTVYAAEQQDELIDKILKAAYAQHPLMRDNADKFRIHYTDPTRVTLAAAAINLPVAFDLSMTVIRNTTIRSLVTSDNPAIFYNQFLEKRKVFGGITGLACKGLQIFLPLSPRHCLFFYDGDVYNVAGGAPYVDAQPNDVTALNTLQYIAAYENIYFDDAVTQNDIAAIEKIAAKHRQETKTHVDEYVRPTDAHGRQSLLHTYKQEIRCGFALSFINLLRAAKDYQLGNKAVHVRNETIVRLHEDFVALVEKGFYRVSQFPEYLNQVNSDPNFFRRHNILSDSGPY